MCGKIRVEICVGTSCHLMGNSRILNYLENLPEEIKRHIDVNLVSCFNECKKGPRVNVGDIVLYNATSEKVMEAIKKSIAQSEGREVE
ncbi:MAG: NAD(P)H-dependent oxidoreductase subunit E [Firmicutes bacterium]|nr:NAD(P)H-dependent oxidoreductase subunit E [Bacillota bacterium]